MKIPINKMSDKDLLDAYKVGSKWLVDHAQVTGTNKNNLGEEITQQEVELYTAGLRRLERIEKEMQIRGIAI